PEFDYQAFAPAVFLARKLLHGGTEFRFRVRTDDASHGAKPLIAQAHFHTRGGEQVLHPVAGSEFRDHVVETMAAGEPDLDFPRLPAAPASSRQIQVSGFAIV